jgi:hypothetical protein
LGIDAFAHFQDLKLSREEPQNLANSLRDIDSLNELRLLLDRRIQIRRDQVGECSRCLY